MSMGSPVNRLSTRSLLQSLEAEWFAVVVVVGSGIPRPARLTARVFWSLVVFPMIACPSSAGRKFSVIAFSIGA